MNDPRFLVWVFGLSGWTFGLTERTFSSLSDGLIDSSDLGLLFTAALFASFWFILKPEGRD